jgi:hypothetical protein
VLEFSGGTDDRTLAITLNYVRIASECGHERASHFKAQGFQVFHEAFDLFDVTSGIGILNHYERRRAA